MQDDKAQIAEKLKLEGDMVLKAGTQAEQKPTPTSLQIFDATAQIHGEQFLKLAFEL